MIVRKLLVNYPGKSERFFALMNVAKKRADLQIAPQLASTILFP
jgi:hypothetical protein